MFDTSFSILISKTNTNEFAEQFFQLQNCKGGLSGEILCYIIWFDWQVDSAVEGGRQANLDVQAAQWEGGGGVSGATLTMTTTRLHWAVPIFVAQQQLEVPLQLQQSEQLFHPTTAWDTETFQKPPANWFGCQKKNILKFSSSTQVTWTNASNCQ